MPTSHDAGRSTARPPRRGGRPVGIVLAIGPQARHALERLTAVGVLSVLAVFLSAPFTIHTGIVEQARDITAVGHHQMDVLVAHARYDAVHVGDVSFSAMIVAELLGTLTAIAVMISWAERRTGNRAEPRTMDRSDRPDGIRS